MFVESDKATLNKFVSAGIKNFLIYCLKYLS